MGEARFDFHNPFMSAVIVTTDGERFPLWVRTEETARLAVGLPDSVVSLAYLQELTVEIQLAYLPIIKATLAPPYRDAIALLDSTLIEWGQSTLDVTIGYIGENGLVVTHAQPFSGVLMKPEIQLGQDITITLNAQGVGGFGASSQSGLLTENDLTRRELVLKLIERFSLNLDDDEVKAAAGRDSSSASGLARASDRKQKRSDLTTTTRAALRDARVKTDKALQAARKNPQLTQQLTAQGDAQARKIIENAADQLAGINRAEEGYGWLKEKISFVQGGDTYWTAVLKLVRQAGLHAFLLGNTLRVVPSSYIFSSAPKRIFRLYDFPGGRLGSSSGTGSNLIFPILGASSPTMAIYMPNAARGVYAQDYDSGNRTEEKKFVGEKETAPPRTDKGAADASNPKTNPAPNEQTGEGAETYPGNPGETGVIDQMKAEYTAYTAQMGIQLTIESLGDPTLDPGTVIAVAGLGRRVDSNYSILKMTHTIGSGGYSMSLECVSNVNKAAEAKKNALGNTAPPPSADLESGNLDGIEVQPKNVG